MLIPVRSGCNCNADTVERLAAAIASERDLDECAIRPWRRRARGFDAIAANDSCAAPCSVATASASRASTRSIAHSGAWGAVPAGIIRRWCRHRSCPAGRWRRLGAAPSETCLHQPQFRCGRV